MQEILTTKYLFFFKHNTYNKHTKLAQVVVST
uniref:Uncharacterized protein n=1 Tax=Siphoviridae sp. ctqPo10 TaxID=2827948 RepID=A0A8S5SV56_9CAUD|nr:MAG TPA: hypothetical protein [Siphoviridae sp. ctqPo10]